MVKEHNFNDTFEQGRSICLNDSLKQIKKCKLVLILVSIIRIDNTLFDKLARGRSSLKLAAALSILVS